MNVIQKKDLTFDSYSISQFDDIPILIKLNILFQY